MVNSFQDGSQSSLSPDILILVLSYHMAPQPVYVSPRIWQKWWCCTCKVVQFPFLSFHLLAPWLHDLLCWEQPYGSPMWWATRAPWRVQMTAPWATMWMRSHKSPEAKMLLGPWPLKVTWVTKHILFLVDEFQSIFMQVMTMYLFKYFGFFVI